MIDHFRGVQKMAPSDFDALIGEVEPIEPRPTLTETDGQT